MARTGRPLTLAPLLAAAALILVGVATHAQERERVGRVEVTIQLKGGGKVPPVSLYLDRQRVDLPAGATTHLFQDVPVTRSRALTGDAKAGGKRFVGVEPVAVISNRTTKATLILEEAPDIERFCGRCHPGDDAELEAGQILRDRHVSGKVLGEKYRAPLEKYNAGVEDLRRQGKPHNEPILLEKRVVVEGGRKVERLFYTCESCHTLHWRREEQKYARALFRKQGELCRGCHP